MSKLTPTNITNLTDISDLTRFLNPFVGQVVTALNNGLSFQDNIRATTVAVTFPGSTGLNLQIKHGLAVAPIGYIPIRFSGPCKIYDGISAVLGATFANLKCDTGGITATILFF